MTQYTIEMAFDWDTVREQGENTYLLENTPQKLVNNGWQQGSYADLLVGDTLQFPVYDNSSETTTVGTVTGFTVSIVDAESGVAAVPFAQPLPSFGTSQVMARGGYSASYGNAVAFTWPLGSGRQTLHNEGRYLVTMTLTVQKGSETKTFSVDPEWIVGKGG